MVPQGEPKAKVSPWKRKSIFERRKCEQAGTAKKSGFHAGSSGSGEGFISDKGLRPERLLTS